jgi:hypothetical protein
VRLGWRRLWASPRGDGYDVQPHSCRPGGDAPLQGYGDKHLRHRQGDVRGDPTCRGGHSAAAAADNDIDHDHHHTLNHDDDNAPNDDDDTLDDDDNDHHVDAADDYNPDFRLLGPRRVRESRELYVCSRWRIDAATRNVDRRALVP